MRRAIALLALLVSACGTSSTSVATGPTPSGLQYKLAGIHTSAAGTIRVTTSGSTTNVELTVTGLAAFSSHIAHVYSGTCEQPGAILYALTQVVADANGASDTKTVIQAKYPPTFGTWFVAVHAGPDMQGPNATNLLCGNLAAAAPGQSPPAGQTFPLNGIKTNASGHITVSSNGTSTTIEVVVTGLNADSSHVSHIHSGTCSRQGGILFALNEVVADGTGAADTRTTIPTKFPPASGTWYVVVHAGPDMQGANATYLLCGNLS